MENNISSNIVEQIKENNPQAKQSSWTMDAIKTKAFVVQMSKCIVVHRSERAKCGCMWFTKKSIIIRLWIQNGAKNQSLSIFPGDN